MVAEAAGVAEASFGGDRVRHDIVKVGPDPGGAAFIERMAGGALPAGELFAGGRIGGGEQRGDRLQHFLFLGRGAAAAGVLGNGDRVRSEEHTSELQSLMRISYAVFCLKKKTTHKRDKE